MAKRQVEGSSDDPTIAPLVQAIKCSDWGEVLRLLHRRLWKRSAILFDFHKDIFHGMNVDDVFDEVQHRLLDKLQEKGYAECGTNREIVAKTCAFISYSLREVRTARIRRRNREAPLGDCEPDVDRKEEDSYEKQMLVTFLRHCIEDLRSAKQRELGRLMLEDKDKFEVATLWGDSKQNVQNVFARMVENLRKCIEMKRGYENGSGF